LCVAYEMGDTILWISSYLRSNEAEVSNARCCRLLSRSSSWKLLRRYCHFHLLVGDRTVVISTNRPITVAPFALDDTDVFDPSRFLQDAQRTIERHAYLPFGVGHVIAFSVYLDV
jgi:hypothetical protein